MTTAKRGRGRPALTTEPRVNVSARLPRPLHAAATAAAAEDREALNELITRAVTEYLARR